MGLKLLKVKVSIISTDLKSSETEFHNVDTMSPTVLRLDGGTTNKQQTSSSVSVSKRSIK